MRRGSGGGGGGATTATRGAGGEECGAECGGLALELAISLGRLGLQPPFVRHHRIEAPLEHVELLCQLSVVRQQRATTARGCRRAAAPRGRGGGC